MEESILNEVTPVTESVTQTGDTYSPQPSPFQYAGAGTGGNGSGAEYAVGARKSKTMPIVFIALLVIVALVAAAFLLLKGGNSSYAVAEGKNLAAAFGLAKDSKNIQQSADYKVTFTPEKGVTDLLGITEGLNSTTFQGKTIVDGTNIYGALEYLNGSKKILGTEVWTLGQEEVVIALPELLDQKVVIDLVKYMEQITNDYTDSSLTITDTDKLTKALEEFDQEVGIKYLEDVAKKYFELTKNAPVEKDVDFSVGDITVKADKTTITFTPEILTELIKYTLTQLKEYPELVDFIKVLYGDDFIEQIDEALKELENLNPVDSYEDFPKIVMEVYIVGEDIVSREFSITADGEKFSFVYSAIEKDGKTAGEFSMKSDIETLKITNNGTVSNGKYSGQIKLNLTDYKFTIDYTDFEIINDEFIRGSAELDVMNMATLNFTFTNEGQTQGLETALSVSGEKYATLYCETTYTDEAFTAPNKDNALTLTDPNSEEELNKISEALNDKAEAIASDFENFFIDNGKYDVIGYAFSAYANTAVNSYLPETSSISSIIGGADGDTYAFPNEDDYATTTAAAAYSVSIDSEKMISDAKTIYSVILDKLVSDVVAGNEVPENGYDYSINDGISYGDGVIETNIDNADANIEWFVTQYDDGLSLDLFVFTIGSENLLHVVDGVPTVISYSEFSDLFYN